MLNDPVAAGKVARAGAKYVPARVCGSLLRMNSDTTEKPRPNAEVAERSTATSGGSKPSFARNYKADRNRQQRAEKSCSCRPCAISLRSQGLVQDKTHRLMVTIPLDDDNAWTEGFEDFAHRNLRLIIRAHEFPTGG